ncbi:MAG TPA: hypothetical protein VLG09_05825 [Candidatus Saccharimonadales bacterium]|nr:hypothetical protein [Candidatus Saccharimonadales bacterium]
MSQIPKADWERNHEIATELRKRLGKCRGISAIYNSDVGLTLTVRKRWFFFRMTIQHPAALCTPAIVASAINQVGLGNYLSLLSVIRASDEVAVRRSRNGKLKFAASGTLSP